MSIGEIESLLKQTIGLDSASVGLPMVERAVHQRMAACGLKSLPAYLEKVHTSTEELQELIEAVVVSETWFFRDKEAFIALGEFVLREWLPSGSGKLRLLSIPCATGEEPYSLAMTLDGLGLTPEGFHIDAVDISEQALARARKAVYGRNSFRGKNLDFRDQYFEPGPQGYHLSDSIRKTVLFQQANLFSPDFFPGSHHFHFIFCRNLLIYFDPAAQDRAIQTLKRLLVPQGILFVGPAETSLMLNHNLVSVKRPLSFAFRQGDSVARPVEKKAAHSRKKPISPPMPVVRTASALKPAWVPARPSQPVLPEKEEPSLKLAHRLADEGRLKEAVQVCEDYLKKEPSTEAFYLLGVIHDAGGNTEKAGACYRKALYLDPEHYESLMHLSYFAEKGGDSATAQNLRARAQRIKEKLPHA